MNRERLTPTVRRAEVLAAALRVAEVRGYRQMTRDEIATEAHCSPALVTAMLGTMTALRRHVLRAAVAGEVLPVIAQGLAARDAHAMRASDKLRRLAGEWMANAGSMGR